MSQKLTFKACLFDLDGTLVDTIGDIVYAMNAALAQVGIAPIDSQTCMRFVGRGLHNALKGALVEFGSQVDAASMQDLVEVLLHTYREHPYERSGVYPGIESLLQNSVASGLAVGVLSNKEDSLVKVIVRKKFPNIPFAMVQGACEGVPLKPDPATALDFARSLDLNPSEVLFVGDSEVDAQTAIAAGMPYALVTWGFRPRAELAGSGYNPLYDTVADLEKGVMV
ncbi:MAG: HAD family hydrolase [Spirochaetae bacterium HGW-Spirochaetae-8]|nr:MAG: HAD family hydrolase [Spirochaetae bacterium HGW-Spirochaetae-8]